MKKLEAKQERRGNRDKWNRGQDKKWEKENTNFLPRFQRQEGA